MKVTRNWLRQYVDFDWPAEELAERLTLLGLEVEGLHPFASEFEGIVVAEVLTRDPHPNADKLTLCRVQDGRSERQIVCGAHNFHPGDKVPLILPGATLPAVADRPPLTIKVGKIRGCESHGMLCSPQELGLPDAIEGILILRPDAQIGQSFAEYLGRADSDTTLDLEITPNRPDLNSVLGIAREIAAVTGNPLRSSTLPDDPNAAAPATLEGQAAVRLEDPDLCPRYVARILRGVRVGPSPDWLRHLLEKVGVRAINNIVDITNYVMLETGQPLHAFDLQRIDAPPDGLPTIVVRRAHPGETFTTLDGQSHALSPEMLLIADPSKGIALAGVMGGANSEIHDRTVDVLLESAWFLPTNIRRTAKALGLRTDASYRFERGVDIGLTDWASRRAAQLMIELAGGQLVAGAIDAYPRPVVPTRISLRHHKANQLLGLQLQPEEMNLYLSQLGLRSIDRKPRPVSAETAPAAAVTFQIPSWRPDLKRETDLFEEIARLHGIDKIPATPPRGAIGAHPFDMVHDQHAETRRLLASLGLHEAQGQTLISETAARLTAAEPVLLQNPLSVDMNALRPSLLPGLLDSLRHNLSRQNTDVALFEIGRVFVPGDPRPGEPRHVALALTGRRNPAFWQGDDRESAFDLHDLKGLLEEFLEQLGLRAIAYQRRDNPPPLFIECADIKLGGKVPLGQMGQLHPVLARQYDLRHRVFLAELNLDELLGRRVASRQFKTLPTYPAVRRDVALVVPDSVTHDAVLAAVRQTRAPFLEQVELFDLFRGKNIPAAHKSLAYAFTYRSADRTLTDAEVNATHDQVVKRLKQDLGAAIRE